MASSKTQYQFIDEPDDDLKCSIYLEVAKGQPMQHGASGCGKLFCKECIEKNGDKPCPICRGKNPKFFEDVRSLREIKALSVRCGKKLCEWTGTVSTLEDHVINTCGYTLIKCKNNCRKKKGNQRVSILRKDLDNHLKTECPNRSHKCKYCGEEGTYASITGEHAQLCLKQPIFCLNKDCWVFKERGKVQDHVANECEHTMVSCKYGNIGCTEKGKRKDIKNHGEDDRVHFKLALKKVAQQEHDLKEMSETHTEMLKSFQEISAAYDSMSKTFKAVFNKVEAKTICKTFSFLVPGYTVKRKFNLAYFSEPFFTVPNSYKMRVVVYCNGFNDGEETHVSVGAQLLDGPHKDKLKWRFKGSVKYELLNQCSDEGHKTRDLEFVDNELAIIGQFITHSELTSSTHTSYLVKDTLQFRVTVRDENDC